MLAPCGLTCTDCEIYTAAQDPKKAEELAIEWQKFDKNAKPEWFKCRGCHGEDELVWDGGCDIRECCIKIKKLDNCSLCDDFPCEHILNFENDEHDHHTAAVANLRKIRGE